MANTKKTSSVKKASSVKKSSGVKKAAGVKKTAASVVRLGEPGKAIGQNAYKDRLDLVEVEIVDGVTEIGSEAFSGCVNLESVKIPKCVTRIGDEAFRGCSKLQNVVMAEGIEEIGNRALAVCKSLKEIAIPASVKEIEDAAFVACVGLDRISFASGETRIDEEAFKWCAVVRKVEVPVGLQEGCALLESRGYRAIKAVADRNAKYGDDVELRVARLELWSYFPTIGTAWVDSLNKVNYDLAECARDEGGGWGALDISDIGGELKIDGEAADIDFNYVRRVKVGAGNTWSEFRDKIGIYSVEIDKADCLIIFATAGDFDQKKLTFYYKTAIGPGYYDHPEHITIDLLDRVEYDGVELELDYGSVRNNKGCVFSVFNKGKYAGYGYGCDVEDLNWKKFPGGSNWDRFGPSEWARILSSQPQFADKCDKWDDFGRRKEWDEACPWARILSSQPQFADKCDKWDRFDAGDWVTILRRQPQFAARCKNWNGLKRRHWMEILLEQPQLADKCDKWDRLAVSDWTKLLSRQPQFADKCHKWDRLAVSDWTKLLSRQPQFADKCHKWGRFAVSDWTDLLSEQPQFADKCDKWERFDDIDIARLASEQEAFVPKLLQQKKLSPWSAAVVLAKRPSEKVDTKLLSGKVDDEVYSRMTLFNYSIEPLETPWAYLLSQQPQFAGKFKGWKTLSVADWIGLLLAQPGLASHCDWKKFKKKKAWDADYHGRMLAGNDELIALIRAKTGIDIMERIDFDTFVKSPTLVKDFDLWKDHLWKDHLWDRHRFQAKVWSEILSRYPDLATRLEEDVILKDVPVWVELIEHFS